LSSSHAGIPANAIIALIGRIAMISGGRSLGYIGCAPATLSGIGS